MPHGVARVAEWASRNGLALCCVVAPLLFALIAFNGVLWWLTPDIATNIHIDYRPANAAQSLAKPATTTTTTTTTTTAGDAATTTTTTTDAPTTKPESAKGNDTAERTNPNQAISLRALQYRGEARYAAASAFIYLASAAVLLFSLVIVYRRLDWRVWGVALLGFVAISYIIAYFHFAKPRGRELIVENVLNAAEQFEQIRLSGMLQPKTGDIISSLVSLNTIAALVPVGMLLVALAALSVRDPDAMPDPADLKLRRTCLRIALGLASALFVIGVLANKILVAWPLSLIIKAQRDALQPLAEAVTLELGAMGTIAIIAAFTPAIIAWWLDVEHYRRETADKAQAPRPPKHRARKEAARAAAAADTDETHDPLSEQGPLDEFVFAPLSTISGIIAALAPLLASPVVDAIRSLLSLAK